MLHSYHDNQMAMTNHIVPEQANKKPASSEGKKSNKKFGATLDSSQLEGEAVRPLAAVVGTRVSVSQFSAHVCVIKFGLIFSPKIPSCTLL